MGAIRKLWMTLRVVCGVCVCVSSTVVRRPLPPPRHALRTSSSPAGKQEAACCKINGKKKKNGANIVFLLAMGVTTLILELS